MYLHQKTDRFNTKAISSSYDIRENNESKPTDIKLSDDLLQQIENLDLTEVDSVDRTTTFTKKLSPKSSFEISKQYAQKISRLKYLFNTKLSKF